MKKKSTGIRRLGYTLYRGLSVFTAIALLCCFTAVSARASDSAAEAEKIVNTSQKTLESFMADPQMDSFRSSLQNATAVLIIPELLKAGILVAGSGGNGVFLLKDEKTDRWSYPYFYTMVSASIGLQVGAKASELMLLFMNRQAVDRMLASTKFELGGDATVSAGAKGGSRGAVVSDILSYSRTKGLFGGFSVDGGMIQARPLYNKYYYGPEYQPMDILIHQKADNPQADPLRDALKKAAE
jgi:SH3 domain-containing YSC84-like protein 1